MEKGVVWVRGRGVRSWWRGWGECTYSHLLQRDKGNSEFVQESTNGGEGRVTGLGERGERGGTSRNQ